MKVEVVTAFAVPAQPFDVVNVMEKEKKNPRYFILLLHVRANNDVANVRDNINLEKMYKLAGKKQKRNNSNMDELKGIKFTGLFAKQVNNGKTYYVLEAIL